MNLIPDPLHPAVVHFPIVLILLGAATAVVAAVWRRSPLPVMAAVLLGLGALGAWAAVESGESAGGLLETGTPGVEALIDAHETWAQRTLGVSCIAALAAASAAVVERWPRVARGLALLAALASVAAAYTVYETGHRGGALVYKHAAGVELASQAGAARVDERASGLAPGPESGAQVRESE